MLRISLLGPWYTSVNPPPFIVSPGSNGFQSHRRPTGDRTAPSNDRALSTSWSPLASRSILELDWFIACHPTIYYMLTPKLADQRLPRSNQRQEPNRYFARCDRAHYSLIPLPSLVISNGAKIFKTGSLDGQPHFVQTMEVSITHEERAERVRVVFDQAHARSKIPGCSTSTGVLAEAHFLPHGWLRSGNSRGVNSAGCQDAADGFLDEVAVVVGVDQNRDSNWSCLAQRCPAATKLGLQRIRHLGS